MSKTIAYYFAPQSPYAYLGHARLLKLGARYGAVIAPKPVDMSAIFAASGGVPLAQRAPQRQAYRLEELKRWSDVLGVPLNLQPAFFPVDQTAASLLLVATLQHDGVEAALELAGAILRAVWAEERDIADMSTLHELADACGLDGAPLMVAAASSSTQQQYKAFTQEAITAGMFGAPWYVIDGQHFWGQDRFDFIERLLEG